MTIFGHTGPPRRCCCLHEQPPAGPPLVPPNPSRGHGRPAAAERPTVGSYVDTDGVRRAPQHVGSYVTTTTTTARTGAYTDRDGTRTESVLGSYTRVER